MIFPPQDVITDAQSFENARVWEIAHRFRDSAAKYASGGDLWNDLQKHGVDASRHKAFLEVASSLFNKQHRNLTAALLLAGQASDDGNAAYIHTILDGAWERDGLASGNSVERRLSDCAWRLLNPLCHMALGYRRSAAAVRSTPLLCIPLLCAADDSKILTAANL